MSLEQVIQKIEQARLTVDGHHIVKLVAVSKYVDTDAMRTLYQEGQRAFGENKVQDLETKSQSLDDLPIEWHFIGTLQTNKINKLIDLRPALMQSLSSLELAEALERRLEAKEATIRALLQVNAAKEESKSGVTPEAAVDLYREITARFPHIKLEGVMTIGAHTDDHKTITKSFETTRKIFDDLSDTRPRYCSMGMSQDYDLAIRCGSNMVRLGSVLFK